MKAIVLGLSILFTSNLLAKTCAEEVKELKSQVAQEVRRILLEARNADEMIDELTGSSVGLENAKKRRISQIKKIHSTGWFSDCENKRKAYSARLLALSPMTGKADNEAEMVANHFIKTYETYTRDTSPKEVKTERRSGVRAIRRGGKHR